MFKMGQPPETESGFVIAGSWGRDGWGITDSSGLWVFCIGWYACPTSYVPSMCQKVRFFKEADFRRDVRSKHNSFKIPLEGPSTQIPAW